MSGPIKLHYFNAAALAEPIRFMLHYGGMKFTDERFADWNDFLTKKENFPYGKVPVLEIEGKTLHQTKAIMRYLAKKQNLVGKSDWDSLECDIMTETIDDLRSALASYFYDSNESSKAGKKDTLFTTTIPFYMNKFEAHVAKNGGHFVNGQMTWADFYFAGLIEYLGHMASKDLLTDKPALKALHGKVVALKGIKEHIATRPPPFPAH